MLGGCGIEMGSTSWINVPRDDAGVDRESTGSSNTGDLVSHGQTSLRSKVSTVLTPCL